MPKKPQILVVEARYYAHISNELLRGAQAALEAAGADYDKLEVPGCFEIPAAIALAAASNKYDGFVALGCVIRGETSHYDLICAECARGIQDLALKGLAVGFGVLTVENERQAMARARKDKKDKGGEAARACLAMVALKQRFSDKSR
jgi:6,7-dimethyl-8-ribityllumazine synthase